MKGTFYAIGYELGERLPADIVAVLKEIPLKRKGLIGILDEGFAIIANHHDPKQWNVPFSADRIISIRTISAENYSTPKNTSCVEVPLEQILSFQKPHSDRLFKYTASDGKTCAVFLMSQPFVARVGGYQPLCPPTEYAILNPPRMAQQ
jgi:hypothetical protein